MTISKLSTLKKWAPALTISFASATFAAGNIECINYFENAEIQFFKSDRATDYIFLKHYKDNYFDLWGGSGSIAGKGKVDKDKIDVKLTFTATGDSKSMNLGKLSGKKTMSGWSFTLIPWDGNTRSYDEEQKILFNNCTED